MGLGGAFEAVPILRSDRLVLRPVAPGDAGAVRRLADDFEVSRWMSRIPHPYTAEHARSFVEEIAPAEAAWAIEVPGEGLAGVGGFAPRFHPTDMEFGYWLGRPHWGRGIATEAGGLMLAHAWRSGAIRLRSGCFDGNARSARVLEKLGFGAVGRSTRACLARGCDLPHVDLAMDRPDGA